MMVQPPPASLLRMPLPPTCVHKITLKLKLKLILTLRPALTYKWPPQKPPL